MPGLVSIDNCIVAKFPTILCSLVFIIICNLKFRSFVRGFSDVVRHGGCELCIKYLQILSNAWCLLVESKLIVSMQSVRIRVLAKLDIRNRMNPETPALVGDDFDLRFLLGL